MAVRRAGGFPPGVPGFLTCRDMDPETAGPVPRFNPRAPNFARRALDAALLCTLSVRVTPPGCHSRAPAQAPVPMWRVSVRRRPRAALYVARTNCCRRPEHRQARHGYSTRSAVSPCRRPGAAALPCGGAGRKWPGVSTPSTHAAGVSTPSTHAGVRSAVSRRPVPVGAAARERGCGIPSKNKQANKQTNKQTNTRANKQTRLPRTRFDTAAHFAAGWAGGGSVVARRRPVHAAITRRCDASVDFRKSPYS